LSGQHRRFYGRRFVANQGSQIVPSRRENLLIGCYVVLGSKSTTADASRNTPRNGTTLTPPRLGMQP
jgi:hypothetical protein